MRREFLNRLLVLTIALASLLTTQCLLACSTAKQAAHACCPHKNSPDHMADAAIPTAPAALQWNEVGTALPTQAPLLNPDRHHTPAGCTQSPPLLSKHSKTPVLRV